MNVSKTNIGVIGMSVVGPGHKFTKNGLHCQSALIFKTQSAHDNRRICFEKQNSRSVDSNSSRNFIHAYRTPIMW